MTLCLSIDFQDFGREPAGFDALTGRQILGLFPQCNKESTSDRRSICWRVICPRAILECPSTISRRPLS